ncbi:hypothetical protein [Iamia sp.]|uniref:hypothetical protein n=1 Tax=Iamia sp. TaxID=2722710 RepID=UPI002CD4423D|nr:hypothetical protein [Iamia sp.]HXH57655.1 hypothetical protein [Iamia sp.]
MLRLLALLAGLSPARWLVEFADAVDDAWDVHDPLLAADPADVSPGERVAFEPPSVR